MRRCVHVRTYDVCIYVCIVCTYLFYCLLHFQLNRIVSAVVMGAIRTHAQCRSSDVACVSSKAIYQLTVDAALALQEFMAAGVRAVLEAIQADPGSSAQAKECAQFCIRKRLN